MTSSQIRWTLIALWFQFHELLGPKTAADLEKPTKQKVNLSAHVISVFQGFQLPEVMEFFGSWQLLSYIMHPVSLWYCRHSDRNEFPSWWFVAQSNHYLKYQQLISFSCNGIGYYLYQWRQQHLWGWRISIHLPMTDNDHWSTFPRIEMTMLQRPDSVTPLSISLIWFQCSEIFSMLLKIHNHSHSVWPRSM